MKKIIYSIISIGLICSLLSCGGESKKIETSSEMTEFMGMLNGQSTGSLNALKKFGATAEIAGDNMGMYGLKEPKVTAANGNCYDLQVKAGITNRLFEVCWEKGKINKITDKGFVH